MSHNPSEHIFLGSSPAEGVNSRLYGERDLGSIEFSPVSSMKDAQVQKYFELVVKATRGLV